MALSKVQQQQLQDLVISGATDAEIAEQLKCSVDTIIRWRKKFHLKKGPAGKLKEVNISNNNSPINSMEVSDNEKKEYWIRYFKTTIRYKDIKDRFTERDVDFFCDRWAEYRLQLEDTTPAEESAIELLITYEIRIRSNQRAFKEACENEDKLRQQLEGRGDQELDLENEADRFLFELVMSNNRHKESINKDLKDLADRYDKILESLNATRRQREERQKVGADTFLTLVRQFNDRDRRKNAGLYNERMKIATETKLQEVKQPHTFMDGNIEPVILDGSDFKEFMENE